MLRSAWFGFVAMHPFSTYVIRSYYNATGWNEDNFYAHITRSSAGTYVYPVFDKIYQLTLYLIALLDFDVPSGLKFGISKSPNPLFKTSYSMSALPSLHGSIGYIFTSCDLDIQNSRNVRIKDIVERFRVYDQPRRPEGKPEEWLAGERVDTRGKHDLLDANAT